MKLIVALVAVACVLSSACRAEEPQKPDKSPHSVQLVTVEKGVKLEVLDWGGKGRPLIFLAGLGYTAHEFDTLAPKFTAHHHVLAITRRGYGASSRPEPTEANYAADRLGDDVLAVIDTLRLDRPFVAGHSVAGEELSSIGSRHPGKVAGLIYLDAGMGFAIYDPRHGDVVVDLNDLRHRLDQWDFMSALDVDQKRIEDLLHSNDMQMVQKGLEDRLAELKSLPPPGAAAPKTTPETAVANAIYLGMRKFTHIDAPVLAIYAVPHDVSRNPKPEYKKDAEEDLRFATQQADALQAAVPSACIVRLPYANHFLWRTNEADVVQAMNRFMDGLP
ncbi:MAG: alpha/beta hydrolase [Alphaproteobacteria bacterium]|nr:alpha/beta hydrolase [Alphaproteobacteria bacterium]